MVHELTTAKFDEFIKEGVVLVDFWATWCAPCRMIQPTIEELSEEMQTVKFAKVDIDANKELATRYSIMSIPTLIIFKNGEPSDTIIGAAGKSKISKKIENLLD
ncbi:MAG: thioredoxin [Candidatus Cloacimonetes bacterium]|nr:thioredoxin [Candidatus Cloacimonadota bacterium]